MTEPGDFAARHVAAFNHAVVSSDYADFLTRFTDDAVVRFENVPGASELEFAGRAAYSAAYAQQPPDDQLDIAGQVEGNGSELVVPFAWRGDGGTGTMRIALADGLITRMTVRFS